MVLVIKPRRKLRFNNTGEGIGNWIFIHGGHLCPTYCLLRRYRLLPPSIYPLRCHIYGLRHVPVKRSSPYSRPPSSTQAEIARYGVVESLNASTSLIHWRSVKRRVNSTSCTRLNIKLLVGSSTIVRYTPLSKVGWMRLKLVKKSINANSTRSCQSSILSILSPKTLQLRLLPGW